MNEIGPATEDDMVLAFLQAEVESPRFRQVCLHFLQKAGRSREELIDNADLGSNDDNRARRALLGETRGFKCNRYLFTGFPDTVRWRSIEVDCDEMKAFLYANDGTLLAASGGTRMVFDGAQNAESRVAPLDFCERVLAVRGRIDSGDRFPRLVAIETTDRRIIIAEGNTRATAYVLARPTYPIAMLIGSSLEFGNWAYI